jgi:transposase
VSGGATTAIAAQKKSLIATERNEEHRSRWRREVDQLAPEQLVFLDETSTQTVMTRSRARARPGVRAVLALPRNHGENVTCVAALTPAGITAPLVFSGALDGPIFAQWATEWLVPTLHPGQTIVLDNLNVHKNASARAAIEAAGCTLRFLPASSPDFNPIELAFAKLKAHLRGAARRSFDPLVDAIGAGIDTITTTDIRAFYRHCGYHLPDHAGQYL